MSINLEADLLDIAARQRYLRSLARRGPVLGQPSIARQQLGRSLVRVGVWLEGRRIEERPSVASLGPVARLAGGPR
jgi:hypothetical protein